MSWIVSGTFGAGCLLIWPFLDLRLSQNAIWLVPILVGMYWCHLAPIFVRYRLKGENTWAALHLRRLAEAVALFIKSSIPFAFVSFSFAVYSTLAARLGLPMRDAGLAKLDAFIGFHWLQFLTLVNSSEIASAIFVFVYHSFVPQFVFIMAILSFMRMGERILEFVSLYAVSALIIAAIATIVPAEGAHLYFHPSHEQFSNFTNHSGMWHYHLLVKLRTTHVLYFDPFHLQGMVTFPSFHAAAAVLTAYAVRGVQFIRIPVLAFSLLMIVSAVPEGGHYLVDVIAGVLIAVACIVVRAYFSQSSMGLVADQI